MIYEFASRGELEKFISEEVVNTYEATQLLGCSRQNLSKLVERGRLKPIRDLHKDRLFWKSDIIARLKPSNS
jgi:hypothetical protein